jgi:Zn-dependent protease/CBS domain-containing protein
MKGVYMRWSFPIARLTGIQIRLHLTFFIFLGWIGLSHGREGGWPGTLGGLALVGLVFSCILLHELGHAWAARCFGIATPDITLTPIGGVARLERIPERPREEIIVALAGPLVSALLALGFGLACGFEFRAIEGDVQGWSGMVASLFSINTALLAFNMLPVFPMDGGRVLRALLAMWLRYERATSIAAGIGQTLAVFLGLAALLVPAPFLLFIAVFVFLGAGSESAQVRVREAARGLRVGDAMVTSFVRLPAQAVLADASYLLLHAAQHTFPLMDEDGGLVGILDRNNLIAGLHEAGPSGNALDYARRELPFVEPTLLLTQAFGLMESSGSSSLAVVNGRGELGLCTQESLSELLNLPKKDA